MGNFKHDIFENSRFSASAQNSQLSFRMISVMIEKVKTMIGFCSLLLDFLFRGYPSCHPSGIVFFETAIIYYRGDKMKRLKIKLPFKLKVTVFMVYSCRFPFAKVTIYFVLG